MSSPFRRVMVIVLDGVGIGELPDAVAWGDCGANTLQHVADRAGLRVPALRALGLDRLVKLGGGTAPDAEGAVGRMIEVSAGKDSVTGHWELAGIVLDRPFRVYPDGFPASFIERFAARIGRPVLGNCAASGTAIIERLGPEHERTGAPIVYTSADSVFQIAAHESVVPVDELYRACGIAFAMAVDELRVARVIARPFVGTPGAYRRTAGRRDFAVPPPAPTLLDRLTGAGVPVTAIGKIEDLFAGRGITRAVHTKSDEQGMDEVMRCAGDGTEGLIFANLVDFDTVYGHRNDVAGFAANLERFDARLAGLRPALRDDDLLLVTADHGTDPAFPGTDHTREYVPVLATGRRVRRGADLGTRASFADLGQTVAAVFGVQALDHGTGFLELLTH
ncbi:MAG TPA: phosphopentomutase [Vicinamibacterales bacterium]|nr:phosphopentomutase [Vicinamibacterales bacterium]